MTSDATQTDPVAADPEILRELITPVRFVLWDLDGPICRLFAGHPAHQVARGLVELIDRLGLSGLLTEAERTDPDPHVALLGINQRHPGSDLMIALEEWLTRHELEAVPKALPTPYADPLIRTWWSRGVRYAITTNNSAVAAEAYIRSRGLTGCFPHIYGRTQDLDKMKPDPHCLLKGLRALGADTSATLMIGDAPSDLRAAEQAGVRFLGYARNADKEKELRTAGADVVVNSLEPLLRVVRDRA
ncbi:HAD family hydrolase [Streptomyces deserti]